jgi:hypothetical protein
MIDAFFLRKQTDLHYLLQRKHWDAEVSVEPFPANEAVLRKLEAGKTLDSL